MAVINRIAEYYDEMKEWRQHLHANPEIDFDCFETAAFVAKKLRSFGVDEVHEGIGKTGLVGIIKGKGGGPVMGLRADMDALPIQEVRDLPYKSKIDGKMHACGHDGHTTMLLGAAKYLAETRNFSGSVAVIFQPAEEGSGGGQLMVEEGMMDTFNISEVYALHNWPNQTEGSFGMCKGPIMASADAFTISIKGLGGHAAMPHRTADPVVAAAAVVQALQSIVARSVDPMKQAVVSVTQIHTGDAFNVIPETAEINGTVRTFEKEVQSLIVERMDEIAQSIAHAHGCEGRLNFEYGYPATVNHGPQTDFAAEVAENIVGPDLVDARKTPSMGAEDFSYMLEKRPGAYVFLGQGASAGLHHPEYDFNDEISPVGASFFAKLVEKAQPVSS